MTPRQAPLSARPWHLAGDMVSRAFALLPLGDGTLALGLVLYHRGRRARLAGVVCLVLAGVMSAPVIHHGLQRLHLEADGGNPPRQV